MEFEIQAGVKVDLASPSDVRRIVSSELAGWRAEIARGTRFRHPGALANADAGGLLTLPPQNNPLGPLEGFVWSVSAATVLGLTAAQVLNLYVNDVTGLMAKGTFTATANTVVFGDRGLVLNGGDRLVLNSPAVLTANGAYSVALEVTELPVQLASRLL